MNTMIYKASNRQPIWGKLILAGLLIMVHGLIVLRAQMPASTTTLESASKQAFHASSTAWQTESMSLR